MKEEKYHITGMTCSACSSHVEKAVGKLAGVERVSVNLLTEKMEVVFDDALASEDIIQAVVAAGYGAEPLEAKKQTGEKRGNRGAQFVPKEETKGRRLWVSLLFWIPLMYVSMHEMLHHMFGLPVPMVVMKTLHGTENAVTFALVQLLLVLPIIALNKHYFTKGFTTLWHKSPNMDSLIAVGAGVSMLYGVYGLLRMSYGLGHGQLDVVAAYREELYFESAGTILTLITVGKYLESRSKKKTGDALQKLLDLSPKMATIKTSNGTVKEVAVEEVQKGELFLLKAGQSVPVDGIVRTGSASVEESAITGESLPVWKKEQDKVISATVVKTGYLECEAIRVGEDTTLSQMIRLVEEAGGSKAPIAKLADKVAGVFVPVVMGIALVTFIVWLLAGAEFEFAMSCAIAVLVISCPCALGLATPVAIMVGSGRGANLGILLKSGEALERASGIQTVVLDKTGTITKGQVKVRELELGANITKEYLFTIAGALEEKSEHPLAEAVLEEARKFVPEWPEIAHYETVPGKGIKGVINEKKVCIGNQDFLQENGVTVSFNKREQEMANKGMTPLFVAEDGKWIGTIGAADEVKDSSKEAIEEMKRMGLQVVMLTGDLEQTAQYIKNQVGIQKVIAKVLPEEKQHYVQQFMEEGQKVAMVGDGINDAPALATADVGIAIGAGTDIAIESADIVLMKNDLQDVVNAIRLSKAVLRNIKQNLFWAFFYNTIGIPLAAGVLYPIWGIRFNPMFGALAMSMSSVFVVTNALRLRFFKPYKEDVVLEVTTEKTVETIEIKETNEMTKVMTIEGMMCAHCTGRVQKALEAISGVSAVEMSLENKTATVTGENLDNAALTQAVVDAGYEVVSVE